MSSRPNSADFLGEAGQAPCPGATVAFHSILYRDAEAAGREPPRDIPDYFRDLNLDQIVDAVVTAKGDYNLKPFFFDALRSADAVLYRHEVMRDLENEATMRCIRGFSEKMVLMRAMLQQAGKLYYKHQKDRWFLHAVETYCEAVFTLRERISALALNSRGLLGFRDFVVDYARSGRFTSLAAAARGLARDLAGVQYCILIREGSFKVRKYEAEPDYSAEVMTTFDKFRQGEAADHRVELREPKDLNHVEAKVLEFVALLYPELFARLDGFCGQNREYADPVLLRFDREVQFCVSYLEYIRPLRQAGLSFCYPDVSTTSKEVYDEDGFDLALAAKLVGEETEVVRNSFHLAGKERVFVVSGPNQGGKTTFARSFGQLHHLASIGCPVPGRRARLFLFDRMFVHFEREENIGNTSLHTVCLRGIYPMRCFYARAARRMG